jgi:IS30 family transposase
MCTKTAHTYVSFETIYINVPFKNHLRISLLGCIKKKKKKRKEKKRKEMHAFLSMVDISNT